MSRRMIDIGVNYAGKKFSMERVGALLRSFRDESNGDCVVSISNSPSDIAVNRRLHRKQAEDASQCQLYFTAGCHPHNAKHMKESDVELIRRCFTTPTVFNTPSSSSSSASASGAPVPSSFSGCVAIGEMGLDYNRMFSPKEVQIDVFRTQIRLARELRVPMYMHCRDAFDDFVRVLREEAGRNDAAGAAGAAGGVGAEGEPQHYGVVHCFTGNLEEAVVFIGMGLKLGITGWLLDDRRNAALVEAVASDRVPLTALMVETDAPYMGLTKYKKRLAAAAAASSGSAAGSAAAAKPASSRKNYNESTPCDTVHVLNEVARLKRVGVEQCRTVVAHTTRTFFNLPDNRTARNTSTAPAPAAGSAC